MPTERPNDARVSGAGPRASLSCARKHARPRIHCSRLLGAGQPAQALNQKRAPQVVAPQGRGAGAHRRGAHRSLAFPQRLARTAAPHLSLPKRTETSRAAVASLEREGFGHRTPARELIDTPGASHRSLFRRRLTTQGSVVRGRPVTFVRLKTCQAPHPLQPLVRRPTASPSAEADRHTDGGGAAGPRSWCAPAWRAPKPGLFKQLARDSRAARALAEARGNLVRGGDSRHGCVGREARAPKPVAAPRAPHRSLSRRRLTPKGQGCGAGAQGFRSAESMQGPASPAADC
jgi:hypothetical protein